MGANAQRQISHYQSCFEPGNAIVEIGSGPLSTPELYEIARACKQSFYTCDNKPPPVVEKFQHNADFFFSALDGTAFLEQQFNDSDQKISAAYLDNFDWNYNPALFRFEKRPVHFADLVEDYAVRGVELTNVNSAIAHLQQSVLVDKYSADQCVILFDDTYFDYATDLYAGKGAAAIIYLLSIGWQIASLRTPPLAVMVTKGI